MLCVNHWFLEPKKNSQGVKTKKAKVSLCSRGLYSILGTAETEKETTEHLDLAGTSRPKGSQGTGPFQMSPPSPDSRKKSRGIMRLFGK